MRPCVSWTTRAARLAKATIWRKRGKARPTAQSKIGAPRPTAPIRSKSATCLQRGGPAYVYFLKITHPEPEFHLFLDTDKTELSPGTSGVMFVNSVRKNGFDGEIALSIAGLPDGVTAFCDRIPAGHRDGCIILTAAHDAKLAVSNIVVTGTASVTMGKNSRTLHAVAQPLQETYVPGGGRGHWPVESHAVAVGAPTDILGVKLSREELTLAPGESVRVDVVVNRAPGFTENITLDPRFNHLGRIFGDTLPTGVEIDGKKSKTLLNGNRDARLSHVPRPAQRRTGNQTAGRRHGQRGDQLRDEGHLQQHAPVRDDVRQKVAGRRLTSAAGPTLCRAGR